MSYPPGVTQWHIDYYAGGHDEPREEEEEMTDYWRVISNIEWHNIFYGGAYPRAVRELG